MKKYIKYLTVLVLSLICMAYIPCQAKAAVRLAKPVISVDGGYDTSYDDPWSRRWVEVKWKKVKGAERYVVYRKTGSAFEKVASVKGTIYKDIDVRPGKVYYYVVAVAGGSKSERSDIKYMYASTVKKVGKTIDELFPKSSKKERAAAKQVSLHVYNLKGPSLPYGHLVCQANWSEDKKIPFPYILATLKSEKTAYHEFGHFVGFAYGNIDSSPTFIPIFQKERNKIVNVTAMSDRSKSYAKQSSAEFFAEAYMCMLYSPKSLKKHCPETYAYITEKRKNNTKIDILQFAFGESLWTNVKKQ